jgi:hypothetical protein
MSKKDKEIEMKSVTIRLPDALWKDIENLTKQTGLSRNTQTHILISKALENMNKPRFDRYRIIDHSHCVVYDRLLDSIAIVYCEETLDYEIKFSCDIDVSDGACDHIKFAKDIPFVRQWLQSNKKERAG